MNQLDQKNEIKSNSSFQIFLSYSKTDREIVRSLYQKLQSDGFNIWLDEENILPGQKWEEVIDKAIRTVSAVIICLSENSVDKTGYVQKELKLALEMADLQPEGKIFIIPVKIEECKVPEKLRSIQWANLFESNGYEKLLKTLSQLRFDQTNKAVELMASGSASFPEITWGTETRSQKARGISLIRKEIEVNFVEAQKIIMKRLDSQNLLKVKKDISDLIDITKGIEKGNIQLALIGKASVGKSAVANSLVGANISDVGIEMDLTTLPYYYQRSPLTLAHVPGIMGKAEKEIAISESKKADGLIFIIDGEPYAQELELFKSIHSEVPQKPILVFVNKWDRIQQIPQKDRERLATLIENKMEQFVVSSEDIVYGSAQIYDPNLDEMVIRPLPNLLKRLYLNKTVLGSLMHVFDPSTLNKTDFKKEIGSRYIRDYSWSTIIDSVPFGVEDLLIKPEVFENIAVVLMSILGHQDKSIDTYKMTKDIIKSCSITLNKFFVPKDYFTLDDILQKNSTLKQMDKRSAYKYLRTVILGEIILGYIANNFLWENNSAETAITSGFNRAINFLS